MPLEPDEDEDPTRVCVKCGLRPRWSRHGTCTRCLECAGRTVKRCILARKADRWAPIANDRHRRRYAALKARKGQ